MGDLQQQNFTNKYLKHSLFDLRMFLYTLEDVLYTQSYDLRELYNKRVIHNILKNFSNHFDDILSPKPNDEDYSRSANLKRRYISIKDVKFKEEMKDFIPPILDWDTDFSPLFHLRKGAKNTKDFFIRFSDWLTNQFDPYHLGTSIVGSLKRLGYAANIEDLDLLLFWVLGIEHLINNWIDANFINDYPVETSNLEFLQYTISELKEHIQKAIQKGGKRKKKREEQKKQISKPSESKSGFQIKVNLHI